MDSAEQTPEQPQIYLVTPPSFELGQFPGQLARVLDEIEVACVRLDLVSRDEDTLSRAADALREVTHARDIALVISDHQILAERLGLDGVPVGLSKSVRSRARRWNRGHRRPFRGASRHEGITAGEAGADYVCLVRLEPPVWAMVRSLRRCSSGGPK